MIFKQWKDKKGELIRDENGVALFDGIRMVLEGRKTVTRRPVQFGEYLWERDGKDCVINRHEHIKWQVGRIYSAIPKRALPVAYYRWNTKTLRYEFAHEYKPFPEYGIQQTSLQVYKDNYPDNWREHITRHWTPLKYKIVSIEQQVMDDIDDDDAIKEGIAYRTDFYCNNRVIDRVHYNYVDRYYPVYLFPYAYTAAESYKSLYKMVYGYIDPEIPVWRIEFEVVSPVERLQQ